MLVVCFSDREAYLDRYAEPDKGWTDRDEARWPVPYWHIDTGMAAMILLLAAQRRRAGRAASSASRASGGRRCSPRSTCRRGSTPVGVVSLGYPAPDVRSPSLRRGRRPLTEVVHYGSFGSPA